jgi:hypothetical protein
MYGSRVGLGASLLSSATLSSRRGLYPALALNFLSGTTLDSRVTFTRGTTATFVGSNGLIQTAAINTPRFDFDPVTLAPRGLLIEEQRTNIILQSQTFGTTWTYTGTLTADATAGPDGTATADLVSNTGANALSQSPTLALVPYTISLFVKASTASQNVVLRFAAAGGTAFSLRVNAETGVVTNSGTEAFASVGSQSFGNGWYRVWGTATPTTTDGRFQIYPNAGIGGFTGVTTGNAFIWGAQLEAGTFATSYIPTVASQVTRSADVATMTGTNFSSWYNQSEGTWVGDWSTPNPATNKRVIGTTSSFDIAPLALSSTNAMASWSGSFNLVTAAGPSNGGPVRAAVGYSGAGRSLVYAGGATATDANTIPALTGVNFGKGFDTSQYLNGHVRQIVYFNTRLPNAQLEALTAPSLALPLDLNFVTPSYTVGY